jgi:hypothetical protein
MLCMSSSSIAAAGYDHRRHALRLRYIGGGTYDYLDVPESVFETELSVQRPHASFRRLRTCRRVALGSTVG